MQSILSSDLMCWWGIFLAVVAFVANGIIIKRKLSKWSKNNQAKRERVYQEKFNDYLSSASSHPFDVNAQKKPICPKCRRYTNTTHKAPDFRRLCFCGYDDCGYHWVMKPADVR